MSSLILRACARPLGWLLAVISVVVFLRGHDAPGGGFVGGLLIASAFALHAVAFGPAATGAALRVHPRGLIALGAAFATAAAVWPLLLGDTLLEAQWWVAIPAVGKLGTVFVFDLGVYLVVWGTSLLMLLSLAKE